MVRRLPQLSGRELSRVVLRLGFRFVSQKGSHMKFVRKTETGKEIIVIPNHKVLRKGTLSSISKRLNLDTEKLKEFLR